LTARARLDTFVAWSPIFLLGAGGRTCASSQ
jgi:hypothetical protein